MLEQVHRRMDNLNAAVASLQKGHEFTRSFTSAPSIAQFIAARVIRGPNQRFPDLDILKIKETLDHLLLEQGEMVIMSSPIDNPAVQKMPMGEALTIAIIPEGHELAEKSAAPIRDLMHFPYAGVAPDAPYGCKLAQSFVDL